MPWGPADDLLSTPAGVLLSQQCCGLGSSLWPFNCMQFTFTGALAFIWLLSLPTFTFTFTFTRRTTTHGVGVLVMHVPTAAPYACNLSSLSESGRYEINAVVILQCNHESI